MMTIFSIPGDRIQFSLLEDLDTCSRSFDGCSILVPPAFENRKQMFNFRYPNSTESAMKCLLILIAMLTGTTAVRGQLTEYTTEAKGWTTYSELSSLGFTRASLQYIVNKSDTTFLLTMWDQRPELKNYFSIKFSSEGNTLAGLNGILLSFFEKDNRRNKDYIRIFQLGNEKVSIYKSGMIEAKAIIFSTGTGRTQFTKREVEKLFGRK